jgi:serine/threonine-protein kinase
VTTVSTTPGPAAIGADDKELLPGQDVGEYRIESVLGRGGFGTVYAAVQPVIGKRVAIKVLARRYAADQDIVSRFVAEARAVNQIRHRNIIDIFSFGQLPDGRHYYVMEYLDGEPLDAYIRNRGAMPLDEAIPILRAIARALDAAHAKGIAHRDLKPENILLATDSDGGVFPKLLDFGIAKLLAPEDSVMHRTGTGVPIGTPYYMSPEQCRGRDVDHRTDIYSFGVVAYRVLTGALPFESDDYVELLYKQVNDEPRLPASIRPDLPASVDAAIAWMMQKDRDKRPATVLDGVNALDRTPKPGTGRGSRPSISGVGRSAHATPRELELAATGISSPNAHADTRASEPSTAPAKGNPGLVIGAVALVVLVLAAGVVVLQMRDEPSAPVTATKPDDVAQPTPRADEPAPQPPVASQHVTPDAAAVPDEITLELVGAPEGTSVLRDGKLIGVAPKLPLPYSTKVQYLVLQADNYLPHPITVTPNRDQSVDVRLKPKKRSGGRPRDKDDVESPFNK